MKLKYFIIPVGLLVLGAGCEQDKPTAQQPLADDVSIQQSTVIAKSPDNKFVLRVVGDGCASMKAKVQSGKQDAESMGMYYDLTAINPNPGSDFEASDLGAVLIRTTDQEKKAQTNQIEAFATSDVAFKTSTNIVRAILVQRPPCVMSISEK